MVKTFAGLSVGIIAISFAAIFIKFCEALPSLTIATYRLVISSVILLVIAKSRGIRFSAFSKKQLLMGMLGGLFLSLHFSLWISSLKFTSVASSVVLVTTNLIFVGIFPTYSSGKCNPLSSSLVLSSHFRETISSFQGIGIVLIFMAIIIASRRERKIS